MSRNSKWRQDFEVEHLLNKGSWKGAVKGLVKWMETVEDDFGMNDVEFCLIVRDWDRTRVVTCGTDGHTSYGAEDMGEAIRKGKGWTGWDNPSVHPSQRYG